MAVTIACLPAVRWKNCSNSHKTRCRKSLTRRCNTLPWFCRAWSMSGRRTLRP